jgi:superfamily II DNA/RNA helicase
LDAADVQSRRAALHISVSGQGPVPAPVADFDQCGFPKQLNAVIEASGFTEPTPIQSQVLPVRSSPPVRVVGPTAVLCPCDSL